MIDFKTTMIDKLMQISQNVFLYQIILLVDISAFQGMKMRGLPFQIRNQDIEYFFKEFELIGDSIKIGKNIEG